MRMKKEFVFTAQNCVDGICRRQRTAQCFRAFVIVIAIITFLHIF